jgi:hypothetical protein
LLFFWLGHERRKLELEAAAIVGEHCVALVGGNDESAADGLVCDVVEDLAANGSGSVGLAGWRLRDLRFRGSGEE